MDFYSHVEPDKCVFFIHIIFVHIIILGYAYKLIIYRYILLFKGIYNYK